MKNYILHWFKKTIFGLYSLYLIVVSVVLWVEVSKRTGMNEDVSIYQIHIFQINSQLQTLGIYTFTKLQRKDCGK